MLDVRPKKHRGSGSRIFKNLNWRWPLYALYLAAASLLVAGGLAIYNAGPRHNTAHQEMISVGQGFVRNAIREELKTTFGSDSETRVEALPDHKFLIAGWVDVMSDSGETERQDYSCVIFKSDSDSWVGEKIAVIPQQL